MWIKISETKWQYCWGRKKTALQTSKTVMHRNISEGSIMKTNACLHMAGFTFAMPEGLLGKRVRIYLEFDDDNKNIQENEGDKD